MRGWLVIATIASGFQAAVWLGLDTDWARNSYVETLSGQYYRVLTSLFLHCNTFHFALDVMLLLPVWRLLRMHVSEGWCFATFAVTAVAGQLSAVLCFVAFPQVPVGTSLVGLSDGLHGFVAILCLVRYESASNSRAALWLLPILALCATCLWSMTTGHMPGFPSMRTGGIHHLAAIGIAVPWFVLLLRRRLRPATEEEDRNS